MPDPQNITLGNSPSPAPAGNISLENIPIHTMKDDLKNVGNPNFNPTTPIASSALIKPAGNTVTVSAEKQKNSPFLAQKPATPVPPTSAPSAIPKIAASSSLPSMPANNAPASVANPFQRTINPLTAQGNVPVSNGAPQSNLNLKMMFLIGGIVFLMIAGGAGGYYYWMTRQKEVAVEPAPAPETTPVEIPEVQPEPAPMPIFSLDKPNYLVIDIATADAEKIKSEIKDRAEKIITAEIKTPIEFIVSDENFVPTSFNDFSSKLGLKLSAKFLANLENTFSLFIHNDKGIAKLGLILDAKNETTAKTQMSQEEPLLIDELSPLYLGADYTVDKSKKFTSSQYGDLEIRYSNLISTSELSLDYALFGKKIIISTSKDTLRAVYDYLKNPPIDTTATETTAPVPETTPETAQPVDNLGQ